MHARSARQNISKAEISKGSQRAHKNMHTILLMMSCAAIACHTPRHTSKLPAQHCQHHMDRWQWRLLL